MAHSGTQVLLSADPALEFDPGPLVIEFTGDQQHVHLFASPPFSRTPIPGTLRAFDANGALVAQDGPKPVDPRGFTTAFEVRTAAAVIRRVELQMGTSDFEAIDDLLFEGEVPPPLPPPPVVQILSPFDNMDLDAPTVNITGTVTGETLLPSVTLTSQYLLPPGSTIPPFRTAIPLSGSGTQRTFALSLKAAFGPQVLTVEAQNTGGTGSATVHFTYLPGPIRERFQSTGGTATFGNFQYGGGGGSCQIAVYERGAIALADTTTYVILGDIFSKWVSLQDPQNPNTVTGLLGCPVSEGRGALANSRSQDFLNGRIYAGLPTGVHYVPAPFVQAIDILGGEVSTGLPMADPNTSVASDTWLFQQFARPGQPGLPCTLEIKGNPPVLYVERQGGDLSELSDIGASLAPDSPTLWLSFSCSRNHGPCSISIPPVGAPIENAGSRYCDGTTFKGPLPGPPEWRAVLGDDHIQVPMLGIVRNTELSSQDYPFTHQFSNDYNIYALRGNTTPRAAYCVVTIVLAGWSSKSSTVVGMFVTPVKRVVHRSAK